MSRWVMGIVLLTLGVAGPASSMPLPTSDAAAAVFDDGGAEQQLAKRKKKRKKKKRKSKRQRKKEAEEKKRKEAEEAARKAEEEAAKKAAEQEAARKAAEEEAAKKAAEQEAARRAALPVLAVLPLGGTGVALSDLGALNAALRGAVETTGQFQLQDQQVTDELVAASQSLGIDCASASEACADQLGALAGASYAVVGQAIFLPPDAQAPSADQAAPQTAIAGGRLGVHLALMPVGEAQDQAPARRVRALIESDPTTLADAMQPLLAALLDRQRSLGDMTLTVQPAGATVAVDGLVLGAAPIDTPGGLLPGAHVVRVTQEGYLPREVTVQVGASVQEVTVLLEEDPELLKERSIAWWEIAMPWSLFAVGGVAALGGAAAMAFPAVLALLAGQAFAGISALDRSASSYPQDAAAGYSQNAAFRDTYAAVLPFALLGGGLFVAAGGLLAVSGAGWGSYYFVADRSEE
jgi:hypothetical protein